MSDFWEGYIAVIELGLIMAVPVLLILTAYSWGLAVQAWPKFKLPAIIAIKNTLIGAGASWMAWTVLYRVRSGPVPIEYFPITATAVLVIVIAPFFTTIYLVWLRTSSGDTPRD